MCVMSNATLEPPFRLAPKLQSRADAGGPEIELLGEQRLVDIRAAADLVKLDLGRRQPQHLGVLLDELSLDDDVQRHIEQAELLRETHLVVSAAAGAAMRGSDDGGKRRPCNRLLSKSLVS